MSLDDLAAGLSWADLCARTDPPPVQRQIRRAWFRRRPLAWLRFAQPKIFFSGFPAGPKRDLANAFASTPAAVPGRAPVAILGEMGRSLGKTQIARWLAVHRVMEGLELGISFWGASAPDAHKHIAAITADIPPLKSRESATDSAVRAWRASPMGSLYPSLRVEGGVTHAVLHLDGRRIPLWARGRGGSTRGLELSGIRPSLVIPDDLVTMEGALSEKQSADLLEWVQDDAANLGTQAIPAAVWWIGNAIAHGDALDLAAASGRWRVVRGTVWTPRAPPDSELKRRLLAELLALDTKPIPDELRARWAPELPHLLAGTWPTDPDQDPMALLRIEAVMGPRAFARACMCLRLAPGEALWAMERAHLVDMRAGQIVRADGPPVPLASCRGAVWLDPRGSEDSAANDYAAAAGVVTADGKTRFALHIEAERCAKAGQRALYWRAVDALVEAGVPAHAIVGGYETNNGANLAFGDDWPVDAAERTRAKKPAPIPAGVNSGATKYGPERLDRVTDHVADGRLRFNRALLNTPVWRMLQTMPRGHDDVGDACERADHSLTSSGPDLAEWFGVGGVYG